MKLSLQNTPGVFGAKLVRNLSAVKANSFVIHIIFIFKFDEQQHVWKSLRGLFTWVTAHKRQMLLCQRCLKFYTNSAGK